MTNVWNLDVILSRFWTSNFWTSTVVSYFKHTVPVRWSWVLRHLVWASTDSSSNPPDPGAWIELGCSLPFDLWLPQHLWNSTRTGPGPKTKNRKIQRRSKNQAPPTIGTRTIHPWTFQSCIVSFLCTVNVRNPNVRFGKPNKKWFSFQHVPISEVWAVRFVLF